MNEQQSAGMASNWGSTKGEAQSNRVTYMKVNKGRNQIRVLGSILRRYIYWVTNPQGKKLPFENLDFNRETEQFENHGLNPVKEQNFQSTKFTGELEFDDKGNPKPLGSKKAYMIAVINRATNAVEYMELKKGVFDGINEVMNKLNTDAKIMKRFVDPAYRVPNPGYIDFVFHKTGAGLSTEYKVDLLETMDYVTDDEMFEAMVAQHKQDLTLLEDLKPIDEVFPRKTYDEQKTDLLKFLKGDEEKAAGGKGSGAPEPDAPKDFANFSQEAVDELDD